MAKNNKTILDDPRYEFFTERYFADPLRFCVEVCDFKPSADQIALLEALIQPDAKVSIVSGTGTGKTSVMGRILIWHLLCFPVFIHNGKVEIGSNTYVAAPKLEQAADGAWKEMSDTRIAIQNGEFAWINQYWTINKTSVIVHGFETQWFISQIAMQKGQSVGVAGKHREAQMIFIDEAAGVSDDHFNVINGTQTQSYNKTILASQGVKNTGFFYETHHSLSKNNGGSWTSLVFDSERSPFVTTQWLKDRELESGGKNSIEYRIRVKGHFAENAGANLLTRSDLEPCFADRKIIGDDEPYGIIMLSDVGLGEYRDDSVIILARVIGYGDFGDDARRVEYYEIPYCSNENDEVFLAGELGNLFGRINNPTLYLDNGGVGHTVAKLIEGQGVPVERVDWGKPCFKRQYKERFYNQRACAMVRFRDAVRDGRVVFPQGLTKRMKEKIIGQGTRLPYSYAEAGGLRYKMMSKDDMRKQGIKSPDLIDAMSFAFLEQTNYIVAENKPSNSTKTKQEKTRDKAKDALAELDNL
jgi:hypothetical protein